MRNGRRAAAIVVALVTVAALATGAIAASKDKSNDVAKAVEKGRAKNVIFFLGDGMGESEIALARYYARGADGRFEGIDAPLLTGDVVTHSVLEATPTVPDYVPDSAATGTAWATGKKTSDNRVSTAPGTDQDLKTILEWANQKGYQTGNVSTAEITDATPAVLDSHVRLRACQGPTDMATCPQDLKSAGGPGSIAEQTVQHQVDVVLGGGKQRFDQIIPSGPYAGKTVIQQAQATGYTFLADRASLLAYNGNDRVLGLFSPGNMTTEWTGSVAQPYPSNTGGAGETCVTTNRPATQPSLAEMTSKAIELLDRGAKRRDRTGFFLQVEGASIDKQDHAANPCGQIGETVAFDQAIQVGLAYARTHKDTLVIVTADHAHTSQILDGSEQTASDHAPGLILKLQTADGAPLVVSYGTNLPGRSQEHTGATVRVAAQGPQAAGVVGTIDQTDLFHVMMRAIGAE